MKWMDYREELGIGFNDEQKFVMLKNKINNKLGSLPVDFYCTEECVQYSVIVGERFWHNYLSINYVQNSFDCAKSMCEFLSKYIAFYMSYRNEDRIGRTKSVSKETILRVLICSLDDLNIPYEIREDEDGKFIFPKGAEELDFGLVSEPFKWLADYPTARKAYVKALRSYANLSDDDASNVADNFRKALESFFQEFFKSKKSLENFKSIYGNYLTAHGIPDELKNNFVNLLEAYTKFINNNAKHHDKTSKNVLEYIMYQTGNITRLLIRLEKEQQ